jgi:hypothetical protein
VDDRIAADPSFAEMYDRRYQRGDIVEVGQGWIPDHFNRSAFVVLGLSNIDDVTIVKQYMDRWFRAVTVTKTLNDTTNHIYEYNIAVVQTSVSGAELFNLAKDRFGDKLKEDITILDRSPTEINIRFEPLKNLNVIAGSVTVEHRIETVETKAKRLLYNLFRMIRRRKYRIALEDLPQGVKNSLRDDGYYITTSSNALGYLQNKSEM